MSRATCISRKKRNLETVQRQSEALKKVQRDAKRKFVAQPEISHEAAELILRNQATRTDEKFPHIIHVSHRLALLHGHENVFFCTQCGAVNAGGSPRPLKSLCDGSGESRQKARRKLERGLVPNEQCCGRCEAHTISARSFSLTLLGALSHRALSIAFVIQIQRGAGTGQSVGVICVTCYINASCILRRKIKVLGKATMKNFRMMAGSVHGQV